MRKFARLLNMLVYTPSRNDKITIIAYYLKHTPDPDRGFALAALAGELDMPTVKPAIIKTLMAEQIDPVLFALSYDYVGDLAETSALLWPTKADERASMSVSDIVAQLRNQNRKTIAPTMTSMMNRHTPDERWALLKLAMGGLRIGINARLAKSAFAQAFDVRLEDVEEIWHGQTAPYIALFEWAAYGKVMPSAGAAAAFRPFMLSTPLPEGATLCCTEFVAEWKWDGIRVQLVRSGDDVRMFSRTGDDISASFPDICAAMTKPGVIDGELLLRNEAGNVGSFNLLQQRVGRKKPTPKMMAELPAFIMLYDILFDGTSDKRSLPLLERKACLIKFAQQLPADRFSVSEVFTAASWLEWTHRREACHDAAIEGLMLKRIDSAYVGQRKIGLWYKWKRDPLRADCVLMYAQRGHGKRSSFYSDFTFGCWTDEGVLVPVGKAYFGFTDTELKWLDKWVRDHSMSRFGPVLEVEKALVLEVAFDAINLSSRHKSGVAMRFPRIARLRADKSAEDADTVATLLTMIVSA